MEGTEKTKEEADVSFFWIVVAMAALVVLFNIDMDRWA